MAGITRTTLLYNIPPRPEQPARDGKPARRARPARTGRLGISRSTFYDNFALRSEDDPFIPGTDVRRLRLLHLAANATAVFNDELDELEAGLKRWRDGSPAEQRSKNVSTIQQGKREPPKRRRAPRLRSGKPAAARETTAA